LSESNPSPDVAKRTERGGTLPRKQFTKILRSTYGTEGVLPRFGGIQSGKGDAGGLMPSSGYYCRQADTLFALALCCSDPVLSAQCRTLAIEYRQLAERAVAHRALELSVIAADPPGDAELD
jgi:hypothetical protein